MRILAIRGKNLASLANEFEIQLEEGILQAAGLFAITGPTGSGKSTILDALCLALYDEMPRLPDGHGVSIGHKDEEDSIRIKSNDVSSILRRGTARAYAEVDFLGKDKQSYRARWEISRARGKINGKLQPQKISLQSIATAEQIGEGKKNTLEEIEKCIGLNFNQFRRSVLLAQGDFAVFLKSKKDDRSNLLEKITGTDIYSELSIAAFDRAKNEKQILDKITEKLADKTPLEKEERQALEKEKQRIEMELTKQQKQIKLKQESLKWFATQKILKQDESTAQQEAQQAQSRWDSSQGDREILQQVEQVQPLRSLLQQSIDLAQELTEAENSLQVNRLSLAEVDKKLEEISKQVKQTENNHLEVVRQHESAQPLLQQARQLDTKIESASKAVDDREKSTQQQKKQWKTAESKLKALQQRTTEKETVKQQNQIWQEQNASIENIARQWERWENEIKNYIDNEQSIEKRVNEKHRLEKRISGDQKVVIEAQEKESLILQEKKDLNDTVNDLKKQVDQQPLLEIHQQKVLLEKKTQQLDEACTLAEQGLEQRLKLEQDKQLLVDIEQKNRQINNRQPELVMHLQEKQTQIDEAQHAFNLINAASRKTAKDLRALLQKNEPCPVCGSEEHPWENSELANTINQAVEQQKNRLTTLNTEKDKLIVEKSKNTSESIQLEKDKNKLSLGITTTEEILSQLAYKWSCVELGDKPEWTTIQNDDVAKIKQINLALKTDLSEIKQQEKHVLAQQKKLELQRTQLDQVNEKYAEQQKKTAELDKQLEINNASLIVLAKELSRIEEVRIESINLLNTPFKSINNWQLQLSQDGETFLLQVREDVLKWQNTTEELKNIENQLVTIKTELAVAESDKAQQQDLLEKYTEYLYEDKQKNQDLIDERKKYFEGQSANEFSEQLEKQLQQAEAKKQQAKADLAEIKTKRTSCSSAVEHWQKEQQRRSTNNIAAEQKLDLELQPINLDKETLEDLLKKDKKWIETQKNRFKGLTVKLQEATAGLKVKKQNVTEHEENTPDVDELGVLLQMKELTGSQEKIDQEKEKNSFLLRSDDEKIKQGKELHDELQAQTKRWEKWESLNELIGSSSGQKFRVFAQSLTLETLLSYTNCHLQEFATRYHLQRVPGSDLELQVVDRDMADEVRSVHSLSGGESFLVSLALALGLASLSSNKIQVESLFIDEGFGSLDQETLDIAIASLDTLQSLGRKVGVISHVPVLVERIGAKVIVEKMGGGQSTVSVSAY